MYVCIEAIRRNPTTREATDAEIQSEIVKFLHGAQDRDGGRRRRMKSKKLPAGGAADETVQETVESSDSDSDI